MKRITFSHLLLPAVAALAFLVGLPTFAACPTTYLIGNASATGGWQTPISGTPGTTIFAKFWEVGAAATNNSGTLTTASMITAYSSGYYVYTDWMDAAAKGCPGNPPPTTSRTAFLYSIANAGAAQYLVMSVVPNTSNQFDYDNITNGPGNTPAPVNIPTLIISSAVNNGNGTDTATVTWTPIANLLGYYDTAPANNIITGVAIRYSNGATAPTDFATGSWTLCTNGDVSWGLTGTDPGTATVTFPTPGTGTLTYLSMSILFDGQAASVANPPAGLSSTAPPSPMALGLAETAFVGAAASSTIGPTAAGVFSSFAADETPPGKLELTWRSNVENGVAYYQAYSSSSSNGPFLPIDGTKVNALGNGHVYSIDVPMPTRFSTGALYVKIGAAKMNGGESWSDVKTISTGVTPPTGGSNATSNQGGRR